MERLHLNLRQIREVLPSRKLLEQHALLLGFAIVGLTLLVVYPVLTIPVFGIGLPLYAGWLTLKSLLADRQKATKRQLMQRTVELYLQQAIADHALIALPVKENGNTVESAANVTRFDQRDIELFDPVRTRNFSVSWTDIDIPALHYHLTGSKEPLPAKDASLNKVGLAYIWLQSVWVKGLQLSSSSFSSLAGWFRR
jgi:hypothetical protein